MLFLGYSPKSVPLLSPYALQLLTLELKILSLPVILGLRAS